MGEAEGPVSFFPHVEGLATQPDISLPIRPLTVDRYDQHLAGNPLADFDKQVHDASYPQRPRGQDVDLPPPRPDDFSDPYLMPSVTAHEYMRLTLLWYHTRGLLEDEAFMLGLQEKLQLLKVLTGWEVAIMGLVSEDVYARLVAAGVPLAILPRRESTCSHTINQRPGVSVSRGQPQLCTRHRLTSGSRRC